MAEINYLLPTRRWVYALNPNKLFFFLILKCIIHVFYYVYMNITIVIISYFYYILNIVQETNKRRDENKHTQQRIKEMRESKGLLFHISLKNKEGQ